MMNIQTEYRAYGSAVGGYYGENARASEQKSKGDAGVVREKAAAPGEKQSVQSAQETVQKAQIGAVYEKTVAASANSAVAYDRSGKKPDAVFVKTDPVPAHTDPNRAGAVNASQDYGKVIGTPQLSEEGLSYYNELKEKYGNMDFVLVSKDMIDVAKSQLASYGNPDKMVVLIDEEKVERMAGDKEYRKHYESIIAQAQNGAFLQRAVASSPSGKKAGINVLDNGAGSFLAACAKNSKEMAKKLEKKRAAAKAKKKETAQKEAKQKAKEAVEEKQKSKRLDEKKDKEAEKKHTDDKDTKMLYADLFAYTRGAASLRYNVTIGNDTDSFKP